VADILVAGLGNPMMGDEGIGVRVLERLQDETEQFPRAEFKDLGAGGLTLVHAAEGFRKLIIIDCARMGEKPGTIRRFRPEEVESTKRQSGQSLHEADIMQVLELADMSGDAPGEVVVFGIQPRSVEFRNGLSAPLQTNLSSYVEAVRRELTEKSSSG
jgi:hydrogenase maturation protease